MTLNIRPFTNALRDTGHPWRKLGDNRLGGERLVTLGCLFRGNTEVGAPAARAGDRWLTIQLWGDGNHRVSHMVVTCDCPRDEDGSPRRLRGITRPTDFKTPCEMLIAIQVELLRSDHTPPPRGGGYRPLNQRTSMLVDRFAFALKEKLLDAQNKYGWSDDWARPDWEDNCRKALVEHIAKGDPRDVAAFAAFMWHHGWNTNGIPVKRDDFAAFCAPVFAAMGTPATSPAQGATQAVEDQQLADFLRKEGGQIAHDMAHHVGDQIFEVMKRNGLAQRSEAGATAMLTIAATILLEQAIDQCSRAAEEDCRGAVARMFRAQVSSETRNALDDARIEAHT